MIEPAIVVKVGGSLMDWPELGPRLSHWLSTLSGTQILLIPGGGPTVDVVRNLDQCHELGEEASHWLALRALTLNAHFLATILETHRARVVTDFPECPLAWGQKETPIFDPFPFAQNDEGQPGQLPHLWSATSDSLAARVAWRIGAQRLILLKSCTVPFGNEWKCDSSIVDSIFSKILSEAAMAGNPIEASVINLREM